MTVRDQTMRLHYTTQCIDRCAESAKSLVHNYTGTDCRIAQVIRYLTLSFVLARYRCLCTQVVHGGKWASNIQEQVLQTVGKLTMSQAGVHSYSLKKNQDV